MSYFFRRALMIAKGWGKEINAAWDEADHPRGKTTPESNEGSFAPKGAGSSDQRQRDAAHNADVAANQRRQESLDAKERERAAVSEREDQMLKRSLAYEPPSEIKVGAILRRSWGYEQTNINYYEVTGMSPSGKTVTLREVAQIDRSKEHTPDGSGMSGHTRAVPGLYIGDKPITKRVRPDKKGTNFDSYSSLSLWNGKDDFHSWWH